MQFISLSLWLFGVAALVRVAYVIVLLYIITDGDELSEAPVKIIQGFVLLMASGLLMTCAHFLNPPLPGDDFFSFVIVVYRLLTT
jgi:multisubunit Na+/H+ antiporter MnhB subunit